MDNRNALMADIQRAKQAFRDGQRFSECNAFKWEMWRSRMTLYGRINPYIDDREIQRIAENEATRAFLPDLGNTQEDLHEYQNRIAQCHDFKFGRALLCGLPDEMGIAVYEIPVTHIYYKGATSTNGSGKWAKEEKYINVSVKIIREENAQ